MIANVQAHANGLGQSTSKDASRSLTMTMAASPCPTRSAFEPVRFHDLVKGHVHGKASLVNEMQPDDVMVHVNEDVFLDNEMTPQMTPSWIYHQLVGAAPLPRR